MNFISLFLCLSSIDNPLRYRLMLRRCLESPSPRFGMIMPPRDQMTSINQDFGTMLQIRTVHMLPDGRSMLQAFGISRFRILEKRSLDGYMVGRIEA
jgi:Lon protease-like protein